MKTVFVWHVDALEVAGLVFFAVAIAAYFIWYSFQNRRPRK